MGKYAASTHINADDWLQLAEQALQKINERQNELVAIPELFAQELFTGYMGIFTLDYLQQHCDICAYRFRYALQFFFDIKPLGKLPFQEDEL